MGCGTSSVKESGSKPKVTQEAKEPPKKVEEQKKEPEKEKPQNPQDSSSSNFTSKTINYQKMNELELKKHNELRALHHSQPLKLNQELIKMAQNYANVLAKAKKMEHSKNRVLQGLKKDDFQWVGENLYMMQSSGEVVYSSGDMSQAWYNEIKDYDFKTGKSANGGVVGHFTQLVWNDTEEVGFGLGFNGGFCIGVANYYRGGNFNNAELDNVFPIKLGAGVVVSSKTPKDLFDIKTARENELKKINELREKHHVGKLSINEELNKKAMEHCETIKKTSCFSPLQGFSYKGSGTSSFFFNKVFKNGKTFVGGEIAEEVYKQKENYDFSTGNAKNGKNYFDFSNFAHILWKDFSEVGMGFNFFNDNRTFVGVLLFDKPLYSNQCKDNILSE